MLLHNLLVTMSASPPPAVGDNARASADFTQPEATFFTAIILLLSAAAAFVASMLNRKSMDRATNLTHEREVSSNQHDRFTKIAEQLSKSEESIQLAGVFGLSALADEWQANKNFTQRNVCVELLCAFLRAHDTLKGSSAVHASLISVIRTHCQIEAEYKWPASIINLTKADLSHADLSGVDLAGAMLDEAIFTQAKLESANFTNTSLYKVQFNRAKLEDADFTEAFVLQSNFLLANLNESIWQNASVWGADFRGASFHEAVFIGATMGVGDAEDENSLAANFSQAKMIGVDFSGANMQSSIFSDPSSGISTLFALRGGLHQGPNSSSNKLKLVKQDEKTAWPAGFNVEQIAAHQSTVGTPPPPSAPGDRLA